MAFNIINVVWGEKYIRTFLNLSLPPQFATGNLTDMSHRPEYIIYTDSEGKKLITDAPIYQKLKNACDVTFRMIKGAKSAKYFKTLLKCHSNAIKQANASQSPVVFLTPDCIISSGVFNYIENAVAKGTRLIATSSVRMSLESYEQIAKEKEGPFPHEEMNWSSPELAKTTIHNLHHRSKCLFMTEDQISVHPSHFCWKLDKNNVFMRAYHLHPLLIWPNQKNIYPNISIDGAKFLENVCPDIKTWQVVTHSKEISFSEISSDQQFKEDRMHLKNPLWFQKWLNFCVSEAHFYFFKHDIILGDGKQQPEWEAIISKAKEELDELHQFPPIETNPIRKFLKAILRGFNFYKLLFSQIVKGEKKITAKKVFDHFTFLLKSRSLPPTHNPPKKPL